MAKWILSALILFGLSGCATYVATSGGVVITDNGRDAAVFSASDSTTIRDHYRKTNLGRAGLPAGVGKGDRIPDGVALTPLPSKLEQRLSRLPAGYMRARIGRDVVLVDRKTRAIVDVLVAVGR